MTYNQSTGSLILDGRLLCTGYSGFGAAKNDPRAEAQINFGPIPRGQWTISDRFDSQRFGPVCFHLTPKEGTNAFGRGGFLIHGDSEEHFGLASHGCIVLPRTARLAIEASGDRDMEVV